MACAACGRKYIRAGAQSSAKLVAPPRTLTRSQRMRSKRGVIKAQPQPAKADIVTDSRQGLLDPSTGQQIAMIKKDNCGEDITNKTSSGPGFVNRYPEVKDE